MNRVSGGTTAVRTSRTIIRIQFPSSEIQAGVSGTVRFFAALPLIFSKVFRLVQRTAPAVRSWDLLSPAVVRAHGPQSNRGRSGCRHVDHGERFFRKSAATTSRALGDRDLSDHFISKHALSHRPERKALASGRHKKFEKNSRKVLLRMMRGPFLVPHETDEQLELYALGHLHRERVAAIEEHLLLCGSCQEGVDEAQAFALAMRQAIAEIPASAKGTDWLAWLRQPATAWVGGFATAVLVAGLYLHSGRTAIAPLASLQLEAMRGEMVTVTPARETDITLADAPVTAELHAEVVDASGGPVWRETLASGGAASVKVIRPLPEGDYFVRLYDGAGTALHEYGFRVQSVPINRALTVR